MKNFAFGLDLKSLNPAMLEALTDVLASKASKVTNGNNEPPEEWRPFFIALKKAPAMANLLHQLSHAVSEIDSCDGKTTGIAIAMVFGFELAVAMSETNILEKTVN